MFPDGTAGAAELLAGGSRPRLFFFWFLARFSVARFGPAGPGAGDLWPVCVCGSCCLRRTPTLPLVSSAASTSFFYIVFKDFCVQVTRERKEDSEAFASAADVTIDLLIGRGPNRVIYLPSVKWTLCNNSVKCNSMLIF
jgi:hypothetical protein